MAFTIIEPGRDKSNIFVASGDFVISLQPIDGEISGDWFLYYSDDRDADPDTWQKAHNDAFSDLYYSDIIESGDTLFFQLRGGTGKNIRAFVAHIKEVK